MVMNKNIFLDFFFFVIELGNNFFQGQCQFFCLVWVLFKNFSVLVMDEVIVLIDYVIDVVI